MTSRLDALRIAAKAAELALEVTPNDPCKLRELADTTAELAFECGFHPDSGDEFTSKLENAIATYRIALSFAPSDGIILNNLGVALSDLGRHKAAVEVLRRAISKIPEDRNPRFNLGVALMNTNSSGRQLAKKHFDLARSLTPGPQTRESYFDPLGH